MCVATSSVALCLSLLTSTVYIHIQYVWVHFPTKMTRIKKCVPFVRSTLWLGWGKVKQHPVQSGLVVKEWMLYLSILTSWVIQLTVCMCVRASPHEIGDYLSRLTFSLIAWFGFCLCSFQEQRSPWNDCWLPIVSGENLTTPVAADNTHAHFDNAHVPAEVPLMLTCASVVARETRK